ncbi:5808_t:CDS:2 [Paraglomus brasilianum]|uniref:5808_t:CDS:1 n=1 Tax=Paraglomus brasilianum TaxID=144538 RepID=A0A9N9DH07_9GLOM|nr:5808_t:CDS:2 [Paraglomus brasilianum]
MSCDLSDPNIQTAYDEIVSGQDTNWLILGYNDSRDKVSLYSKGSGGVEELRQNLREEVLYGFLRIENRFVLITYVSEQVSGVRRARALVHGRAVGALFKQAHQVQISASNSNDLSEVNIRNRLKLSAADDRPGSPSRKNTLEQRSPSPSSPRTNQTIGSPSPLKSSISAEPENVQEDSTDETERISREREAAQRKDAERIAREAAARRQQEEADRKRQEGKEALLREKATAEAKMRAEAEKKLRMEVERKKDEELKSKFAELEKSGKVLLDGYITVQGGGVYFWKRRFFELRGKTLYLFRDRNEKLPISKLELDGEVVNVEDAQTDVLINNSVKVDFRSTEPYYFFSDDRKGKDLFFSAIERYVK